MIGGRVAPPTGEETVLSADIRGIIARFYDEINARLQRSTVGRVSVKDVTIWETETTTATYYE